MRRKLNINNKWKFVKQPTQLDALLKAKSKTVNIPHTWNNLDGQDGGNDYYRGSCWYYKRLGKIEVAADEVAYLEFEGVNSIADVYINGQHLVHHNGGFSTFRARIDQHLNEENLVAVCVDNSANDHTYPQFADFTFFGGIYRNVNVIVTSKNHFDLDHFGGQGVKVTPVVNGADATVTVECYVEETENQHIQATVTDSVGNLVYAKQHDTASFSFDIANAHLWDGLKDPHLYHLQLILIVDNKVMDNVEVDFGVRTFHVDPDKGFFLNGKSYPLHGVSRHQDRKDMGWAITRKEHEEDIALIKELGANTIRLAHYQHDQYFYDLCDRTGMVVWAEIPYISQHLDNGYDNTMSQMKELVIQNYHHACIFFWGLSNEISMAGETESLINNHLDLNKLVKSLDSTRLTTMAQVSMLPMESQLNQISDILSYNHYFGWYGGSVEDNGPWFDKFHEMHPTRALGVSEYGCEAILSWHSSTPEQGDYTEEYQCVYHHAMLETFATRPYLWSTHVWNMFDFGVDMRDEGGVKGRNNKGLVTYDRKTKKDSFYLYQAYWTTAPMLHLAQKRYLYRCEDTTKVVVYTNQNEVSLYANGKLVETKQGAHVFEFEVPLTSRKTKLLAKAGALSDTSVIIKVKKPYKKYILENASSSVTNWFDKDGQQINLTYNEGYFSIKDKIKEIMNNPEGKAVMDAFIAGMMEQMAESGMKLPAGAMKMLESFSISRIAKLAGDRIPPEAIAQVNQALQKVKK